MVTKSKIRNRHVIRDERLARITELCDFLKEQPQEITEFDDVFFRRLIQKIAVFDDKITILFKSSISVDVVK